MTKDPTPSRPPRAWEFTAIAAVICLTPLLNVALDQPMSGKMNSMLFVGGVAVPAASLVFLLGGATAREKLAVLLTVCLGVVTLLWVDWSRLDGRVFVIATLFFIPTIVRLLTRGKG